MSDPFISYEKRRYCIKANIEGVGVIQHVISERTQVDAIEKLKTAYPGRAVLVVKVDRK